METMEAEYTPKTPFVTVVDRFVANTDNELVGFEKMEIPEKFEAKFWLPRNLPFHPATMTDLFLPDAFLDEIAKTSSAYAKKNVSKRKYAPIKRKDVLNFLGVYQYMGLVDLPAKEDYFANDGNWPNHPLLSGLSLNWFKYMFRNLHLTETEVLDIEEPLIDTDNAECGVEEDAEEADVSGEELEDCNIERDVDEVWYAKAKKMLDQLVKVSKKICLHPSFALAIDEMMKRFKGRSAQTLRIKNKPIKEGYKFFSICCALTGFVYDIIPDGQLEKSTIAANVLALTESLPNRDSKRYVVAMDNYFTYPKILKGMRDLGVACVGTARAKRGWPPKEMRDIADDRFNTLHCMNDDMNFRICRWVDNNVITMVSTLHDGTETPVERQRRRPRPTNTNRNHVEAVWGTSGITTIAIPRVIDDYNHWMGGVNKADQLIAYYRPDLRCRRTWMPIMFHALDCMRSNAYVACKASGYKGTHKEFTMGWCKALFSRAQAEDIRETRAQRRTLQEPASMPQANKRRRMSHTKPELPEYRFRGAQEDHHMVRIDGKKKPRTCTYCAYIAALNKGVGSSNFKVSKSRYYCFACGDFL